MSRADYSVFFYDSLMHYERHYSREEKKIKSQTTYLTFLWYTLPENSTKRNINLTRTRKSKAFICIHLLFLKKLVYLQLENIKELYMPKNIKINVIVRNKNSILKV